MTKLRIGVFGCGNMGRALVLGMNARFSDAEFYLFTPTHVKAKALASVVGGHALEKVEEMPRDLDWYLLAFKPQQLSEFHFNFENNSKIISVLAGINTTKLISKFKSEKIARLMPNTPASIGAGASLLYLNSTFSSEEEMALNSLLESTGKIFKMESEGDLDLTTAFSGSGPALLFELARIFEVELSKMTEGRVDAKKIVAQTFLGSAGLMKSDQSFEELRNQVTSKKGVTYEALEVLSSNNLQEIFREAFLAAYKRTLELSK